MIESEVKAQNLSSFGLTVLATNAFSSVVQNDEANDESIFSKTWFLVRSLKQISKNLHGANLNAEKAIENKFGPLTSNEKEILHDTMRDPIGGFQSKIESFTGKATTLRLPSTEP